MIRRVLFACALLLSLAWPAQAQIVCEDANFDATGAQNDASAPHEYTVVIPTNIAVGDLLVLGIAERDGGAGGVPTSIVGSASGSWTVGSPISTSSGTGGDTRYYYKVSSASGADTITVTYSSAVTSRLAAGRCTVTGNAPEIDQSDASPATGSSANPLTDSLTPTANGIALAFIALGGDQDITALQTGETDVTNEAQAVHFVVQDASNGVSVAIGALTLDGSRDWAAHFATFKQAAGGGGGGAPKTLMTLGAGGGS